VNREPVEEAQVVVVVQPGEDDEHARVRRVHRLALRCMYLRHAWRLGSDSARRCASSRFAVLRSFLDFKVHVLVDTEK
jgi:hypothetical protein